MHQQLPPHATTWNTPNQPSICFHHHHSAVEQATTNFLKTHRSEEKLIRQLHLDIDHFPPATPGCKMWSFIRCPCWSLLWVGSKNEWIAPAWLIFWHPDNVSLETQLPLLGSTDVCTSSYAFTVFCPLAPPGGTHILRQMGIRRSNGSLFYKKSLNIGPVFVFVCFFFFNP